jgi:muramoyltetrapeptide carboxypeptidase
MKALKPPKLKRGDVLGIVAPSSPPRTQEAVERGISYLEKLGYRVEVSGNIFSRYGYLAGRDNVRASELNAMFANKFVKAIFVARGGYGLHRILSQINFSLIKKNPKIVVGYSDVTALQLALWKKCKLVSLSAPLVVEFDETLQGTTEEIFWHILTSTTISNIRYEVNGNMEMRKQRNPTVRGTLLGGNLSLLSTLCGTPFFPSFDKCIFFTEDVDESPYRIDRMLQHLKLANVFRRAKGIVFGDFSSCEKNESNSLSLPQIFADVFSDVSAPRFSGLRYGHINAMYPIPLGIAAQIHARKNTLNLVESVVL